MPGALEARFQRADVAAWRSRSMEHWKLDLGVVTWRHGSVGLCEARFGVVT